MATSTSAERTARTSAARPCRPNSCASQRTRAQPAHSSSSCARLAMRLRPRRSWLSVCVRLTKRTRNAAGGTAGGAGGAGASVRATCAATHCAARHGAKAGGTFWCVSSSDSKPQTRTRSWQLASQRCFWKRLRASPLNLSCASRSRQRVPISRSEASGCWLKAPKSGWYHEGLAAAARSGRSSRRSSTSIAACSSCSGESVLANCSPKLNAHTGRHTSGTHGEKPRASTSCANSLAAAVPGLAGRIGCNCFSGKGAECELKMLRTMMRCAAAAARCSSVGEPPNGTIVALKRHAWRNTAHVCRVPLVSAASSKRAGAVQSCRARVRIAAVGTAQTSESSPRARFSGDNWRLLDTRNSCPSTGSSTALRLGVCAHQL